MSTGKHSGQRGPTPRIAWVDEAQGVVGFEDGTVGVDPAGMPKMIPVTIDSVEALQDGTIMGYGTLPPAVTEQISRGTLHSVSISDNGMGTISLDSPTMYPRDFPSAEPKGIPKPFDWAEHYGSYEPSPIFESLLGEAVREAARRRDAELEAYIQRVCEDPVGRQLVREILQRVEAKQRAAALDLAIKGETVFVAQTPEEMAAEIAAEMKEAGEK